MHTKLVNISLADKNFTQIKFQRKSIIIINTYEFDTVILLLPVVFFFLESLIKHSMCINDFLWFVHKIIKS